MGSDGAAAGGHVHRVRVYYEDTDAAGMVYHANHLRFAERARTEWLRSLGADHGGLMRDHGLVFTVRRCEIDYLAPARLDDLLDVETAIARLGGASVTLSQAIRHVEGGGEIARLSVRLACIDADGKPARFPPTLTDLMHPQVRIAATEERS